jgi:D-beta-D-heptose 7-phosphate kinase/D-beta-D-heptose 1-phosphate adenosyltransferase
MVKLSRSFSSLRSFKALCVGDFLLDLYTMGRVKRISPEAPVPVMEALSQESRPGGAGNVVLNLRALGGAVFSVGRRGADEDGKTLQQQIDGLLVEPGYRTPVKNRLIADSQQLLRIDFETISPIPKSLEEEAIAQLEATIPTVQVVAVSDYGKGFLTPRVLSAAIHIARAANVPVLVDPKGIDFTKYRGATLLKPNLSEAYAAAKLPLSASLDKVAETLLRITQVDHLLITRSEAGMSLFNKSGKREDFPVRSKEVKDVTGAGDTVLAMMSLGLANNLDMAATIQLANIAAGLSIERLGCVQITLPEIARRLLHFNEAPKLFDEHHADALLHALEGKKYNLLQLFSGQEMTNGLFRSIRKLAEQEDKELIVHIGGATPSDELVHLLSSLNEVDFIVLEKKSLAELHKTHLPAAIFSLKNDTLACH